MDESVIANNNKDQRRSPYIAPGIVSQNFFMKRIAFLNVFAVLQLRSAGKTIISLPSSFLEVDMRSKRHVKEVYRQMNYGLDLFNWHGGSLCSISVDYMPDR